MEGLPTIAESSWMAQLTPGLPGVLVAVGGTRRHGSSSPASPPAVGQLMAVGSSSTPTGISNLGCGKEGNLIQCSQLSCDPALLLNSSVVLQFSYNTAWLWNSMAARRMRPLGQAPLQIDSSAWFWSTLVCSSLLCLALLCSSLVCLLAFSRQPSLVFQLQPGKPSFGWKGMF